MLAAPEAGSSAPDGLTELAHPRPATPLLPQGHAVPDPSPKQNALWNDGVVRYAFTFVPTPATTRIPSRPIAGAPMFTLATGMVQRSDKSALKLQERPFVNPPFERNTRPRASTPIRGAHVSATRGPVVFSVIPFAGSRRSISLA
jgi:hypothetical protein